MQANAAKFLDFLKSSPQFVIPIYQRTYSWTERECRQLWDDVLRAGRNDAIRAHFFGPIVYIGKSPYIVTDPPPLLVIDGQQRLTTVMLILEALARRLGSTETVDRFSALKLRHYYLLNHLETGELHYKLLLTQTDKQSLIALLEQEPQPTESSLHIARNFAFFQEQVNALGFDLAPLCLGLNKLMIIDVALDRDRDDPQLIFESMNSTGRELSQADLIRNFILMGLESHQQDRLYEQHWRPMEVAFGQEAYGKQFDGFMRHYLTLQTGEIPKIKAVYEAFKGYSKSQRIAEAGVEGLVKKIHAFARYYCNMALDQEPDKELAQAFRDLRELRVDVAFPFLLELYRDYAKDCLNKDDFVQAARMVEAYVFRRVVCAIPTNSLNKTFSTFAQALEKDRYLESIQAHFLSMQSYRRFPNDKEFKREFRTRDLYNFSRSSYYLRRLENHDSKERVLMDELTIEHILPQNPNLSKEWQKALGSNWRDVQERWLHTLGNLTLTGYNAEYSDKPFAEKRTMKGGFKNSPLKLNEHLGSLETWDEDAIRTRAKRLACRAVKVWARPALTANVLETYLPKDKLPTSYSLANHQHVSENSAMRPLFDVLRKEILALDPCVSEEILKVYIAYKAETNFVDVVPQMRRLCLILNLHFHELYDPRKTARDITGLGKWGNGDVEIDISDQDQLPYVMGLVRQAFEKQMGNGEPAHD
ncbi:MAG: DUF262 and DUF1524 domain-containing protein [Bacteroidota bacterium]|nr:DUF262 and DUF1524 domain-containing protein [Bacteroidota bacterium]